MASTVEYFGSNVCGIRDMPWCEEGYLSSYNAKPKHYITFAKKIKDLKYQHLFAITANKFQKKIRTILQKQGFKAIVTFPSDHCEPSETLTLWVKTRKRFNIIKKKVSIPYGCNCSVAFARDPNDYKYKNCVLLVEGENALKKDLKKEGFKQVGKTPIWYKLNKDNYESYYR